MIEIVKLTKEDTGRYVKYIGDIGHIEIGRIKAWNDRYIFVVYRCGGNWKRFKDYTGIATRPEDLIFENKGGDNTVSKGRH